MTRTRLLLLALLAPLAGCVDGYTAQTGPTDPNACTTSIVPALALQVRDSVTQKPIASGVYATGMVSGKQGTYVVSQPVLSDTLTIWFGTISGTYSVALKKAGYQNLSKTGIVVQPADSLDCHPNTVTLDILMQRTS